MTKAELLASLRALHGDRDTEAAHSLADDLLVEYIDDPEITEAFKAVEKWYA